MLSTSLPGSLSRHALVEVARSKPCAKLCLFANNTEDYITVSVEELEVQMRRTAQTTAEDLSSRQDKTRRRVKGSLGQVRLASARCLAEIWFGWALHTLLDPTPAVGEKLRTPSPLEPK